MKQLLLLIILTLSINIGYSKELIISTDTEIVKELLNQKKDLDLIADFEKTAIIKIKENSIEEITKLAHEKGRCGGFFVHETVEDALKSTSSINKKANKTNYTVQNLKFVQEAITKVEEKNIRDFIIRLSTLHNRFYQSDTGVEASLIIKNEWSKYANTELYSHKNWKQPSVVATITGSKYPEEYIIVGGHLDSISGFFGSPTAKAPGADDNASGIATITEVIRILNQAGYKPLKTIKFMGYAAEEVGLRGSDEIARDYKTRGVNVTGVMQLDMTNYKGSAETIFLTSDHTDPNQTKFLEKLIDTYLKVSHTKTSCGYACSDHASWTKSGYPAVFPFEASKNNMNKHIHTPRDTIGISNGTADHAVNFARLALAYIVELDLQGVNVSL